ncbi:ATP-dependent metallopeptidase FtsH/Yme1/Tma family protein [Candidatus Peregrinibacteria bacterium]|nr:ATP-dependent metallopeptidase FtsH/Yme1/Tma family protein [Candidatus Peregrinibacteria bacterium]
MDKTLKPRRPNPLISILAAVLLFSAIYTIWNPSGEKLITQVPVSQFTADAQNGKITEIDVKDTRLDYTVSDGNKYFTYKEYGETTSDLLKDLPAEKVAAIKINVTDTSGSDIWLNIGLSVIPFILVIGFLFFMMRGAGNANNQAMSFGKSGAKLHDKEKEKTTFKDVAGVKEAKAELEEIVDFLKHPTKYTAMGAKIPKGVVLVGAPGTGKTLLARAVAGEANVPFFSISGSEFVEMFVGVGASRVRDLFKKAKRNAPCIVFIDEIDAVGRQRGAGLGGGHDEREQTLNQILTEMDGFENNTNVIVMAATNRPDVLDPALLRPGRFDRRVVVDSPGVHDREEILKVHARNKPVAKEVALKDIAKQTPGFSGADLENLMNEAAILAAKQDKKEISTHDIEQSVEKVQLGPERKSHVLSKEEKEVTAFHECGHAIVGHVLKDCDPIRKITIVSRGMSLGSTWFVPDEDKHLYTKQKFQHEMASLLGGYVAEEMIYGQVSTGPSNDLERATGMARRMVTEFGMSPLGPIVFGEKNHEVFLGRDFGHTKNYSEELASEIDAQIQNFVKDAYKTARELLTKHKKQLETIAKKLIEVETLDRSDFISLFEGKKLKTKAA